MPELGRTLVREIDLGGVECRAPDTPAPLSRWILIGWLQEDKLSGRELVIMVDAFEAEAVRSERKTAAAKGEDLSGLNDTDVRIRIMRRERRELSPDLRMLATRKNSDPVTHWPAPQAWE